MNLDAAPASVPTEVIPWEKKQGLRLAGVSSFGATGINSHVVIEEAPILDKAAEPVEKHIHIFPLSAKSTDVLQKKVEQLKLYLSRVIDQESSDEDGNQ